MLLILISLSVVGGCGGGSDNREVKPDPPPVSGDDGDSGDSDGSTDDDNDGNTPESGNGTIRGTVMSSSGELLNGVHVRAVDVDDTDQQISAFSGIDSDIFFADGVFSIQNVPPGSYRILIEKMDSRNSVFNPTRYSLFVIMENPSISFPDEYYNGTDESDSDDPLEFNVITVTAGNTVNGIDFITND